jgi:peptidoglycan hydrolase-like protein with peptidoglycan-binding domain
MTLQYPPFSASVQLLTAANNHPPLRRGFSGPGVQLVQSALLDLGFPLPRSTRKHGVPDGIYGQETEDATKKFQTTNHLKVDGSIGKVTLTTIDSLMAAKAAPVVPKPPPAPVAVASLEYMLGTKDPDISVDPGAGAWNSKPKEASYIALRVAILDALPASIALIGDDAVAHMFHYLRNTGARYAIDLAGMINEVPSARARYLQEARQAQEFVETLPPGTHQITSQRVEGGYNLQRESRNWFFAIGGYVRWGAGEARVTQTGDQGRSYLLDFSYKCYDRYNWDAGKSVHLFNIKVTDHFMGEFHRQGLAREFDCTGSIRCRLAWKQGEAISEPQLFDSIQGKRG